MESGRASAACTGRASSRAADWAGGGAAPLSSDGVTITRRVRSTVIDRSSDRRSRVSSLSWIIRRRDPAGSLTMKPPSRMPPSSSSRASSGSRRMICVASSNSSRELWGRPGRSSLARTSPLTLSIITRRASPAVWSKRTAVTMVLVSPAAFVAAPDRDTNAGEPVAGGLPGHARVGHHPLEGLLARLGAERAAARVSQAPGFSSGFCNCAAAMVPAARSPSVRSAARPALPDRVTNGMYAEQRQALTSDRSMPHERSDSY